MQLTDRPRQADRMTDPSPVTPTEAARLFAPFGLGGRVAVACSGGPDSLALLHLALQAGFDVAALTVDHGLRPEAKAEAAWTAETAASLGASPHILRWEGEKPTTGVQAAAREARYGLMAVWCEAEGVGDLLVAHHLDDQAETFLLRLARGSGVDGLSGMAPTRPLTSRVRLVRPLLGVPKARLRATLEAAGLTAVEDPSNRDKSYDRVKVREMMPLLAELGLDAERLVRTADRMRRARAALDLKTGELRASVETASPFGHIDIDREGWRAAPEELALRLLRDALRRVAGRAYPVREAALQALAAGLSGTQTVGRTLGGCLITASSARISVLREPEKARAAADLELEAGQTGWWDGRFRISAVDRVTVRALGHLDAADRKDAVPAALMALPARVLEGLPALWQGDAFLGLPPFAATSEQAPFIAAAVWLPKQGLDSENEPDAD